MKNILKQINLPFFSTLNFVNYHGLPNLQNYKHNNHIITSYGLRDEYDITDAMYKI
jgi:hypothetical protein